MREKLLLLKSLPMWQKILLSAVPLLLIGGIFIGYRTARPAETTPSPASEQSQEVFPSTAVAFTPVHANGLVRLAWFYKPPEAGKLDSVAKNFDFFILTYKDETERDQLKKDGVKAPFSQYLLLTTINDPGSCDKDPVGNQVAFKKGDFCQISKLHPYWFLLDQKGDRIKSSGDNYYMDPGNAGFRQFWLQRARQLQETYGWDNIFLDNVEASRSKLTDHGNSIPAYPDDQSFQKAVEGFLEYIRQNYSAPHAKMMYGNIVSIEDDQVWDRYLKYLDGAMIESFATDWSNGYRSRDDWDQQIKQAEDTLSQGKTLILVAQGKENDTKLQNFAFASYLLIANQNTYFRYTNSDSYRDVWLYDNYDLNLGQAQGKRYKQKDGWRRDFTNGYVTVNSQNHTAEIIVNP